MQSNSTLYLETPMLLKPLGKPGKSRIMLHGASSVVAMLILAATIAVGLHAQELHSADPTEIVSSTQRLAVQQIDALMDSRQFKDVASQLQNLRDLPPALIESTPMQAAATQHVQPYQPLSEWCQLRWRQSLASDQQLQKDYEKQWGSLANSALRAVQKSKNPLEGKDALNSFGATSQSADLALLLIDIYLERGDFLTAVQLLDTQFPDLCRVALQELNPTGPAVSIAWYRAWQSTQHDRKLANQLLERWGSTIAGQSKQASEVLGRLLVAAALAPQLLDYEAILQWTQVAITKLPESDAAVLTARMAEIQSWPSLSAQQPVPSEHPVALDQRPKWQTQLDRWTNGSDLTPATRPVVGQILSAQPYFPVVYEGKVFLHELTKIRAFQLEDGRSWPSPQSQSSLFDSQISTSAFLPLGYPLQGSPRAGLSITEGCLYARMGSPVTAWNNRSSSRDGGSISYLVGLNLDKQGSLLQGFPLRLLPPQFENAEFEGTPIAIGQSLVVAVAQRDNVGIRRSLAAFDRFSGQLLWRTKPLGTGVVVGSERTNLISASQPVFAGGLIYYSTDLGSVACINHLNGQIVWLSRYQRTHRLQADYPKPNRYRYRDGTACIVDRGNIYCMPQDCPEIFALDALNGGLIWSTDDEDASDCTYQLGVHGNSLVTGGDRLVWLHRLTGEVLGQFPTRSTPGMINALPQPRGLGRAIVIGDRIYWPTAQQIFEFPSDSSSYASHAGNRLDSPPVLRQVDATFCGTEGSNIYSSGPWLLMATPGRLACFRAN